VAVGILDLDLLHVAIAAARRTLGNDGPRTAGRYRRLNHPAFADDRLRGELASIAIFDRDQGERLLDRNRRRGGRRPARRYLNDVRHVVIVSTCGESENDDDGREKAHREVVGPGRGSLLCASVNVR
jgi:hypothetical protein